MVTVGTVAFILNVMILSVLLVSEKLLANLLRSFSASSLRDNRRSPVVHDSDIWLPFLPAVIFKYFKYPWMLITVIIGFLLVASELVAELGVSAAPALRTGLVLNASDIRSTYGMVLVATCMRLQSIDFVDELTRISEGFPVYPSVDTCISCVDSNARNIVSNCSVTWWRKYDTDELEIFLETSHRVMSTVTKTFKETAGLEKVYRGHGDYTSTIYRSSFLFSFSDTNDVHYIEYNDQAHLKKLESLVRNANGTTIHETIHSPVNVYNLSCGESILSTEHFARAAQMYRTAQLENFALPFELNETTQKFSKEFTSDSIYRAVWAAKLLDDGNKEGFYFVYTDEYGKYEWVYLSPLLVSLSLLVFLMMVSSAKQYSPSARALAQKCLVWHLQAQIKQIEMRPFSSSFGQNISTFFKSLFDRMVYDEKTCEGDVTVIIEP